MKQIFKTLVLVAAAVATLTSCEKAPEATPAAEEFTLTVNATLPAPDGTKTYLGVKDGTEYPVLWSENDEIRLYEVSYATEGGTAELTSGTSKSKYATSGEIIRSNENTEATFAGLTLENPIANADLFDYVAYYGNTSNMGMFRRYNDPPYLKVSVPNTQTIAVANQFDTSAALMAAKQLGYATRQTTLDLNFKHLVAYGMLNITKLSCESEKIQSVTFSSNNHNITGQSRYLYLSANDELTIDSSNVYKEVTVDLSNLDVDAESFYVPFAIAPTTFAAGDIITIKVTTNKNVYTREITLTAAQAEKFDFVQGSIIEFSANFEGIGSAKVVKYELVTNASQLAADDVVLLVAMKDSGYYAAGAMSTFLASVAVNAPVDDVISITNEEIDQFTLSAGDIDNNAWKFESTLQPGKFIGWTLGSGNKVTYSETGTNAEWYIENDTDNKMLITLVAKEDETTFRYLKYNPSSPRFAAYKSGQTNPYIYRKKVTE